VLMDNGRMTAEQPENRTISTYYCWSKN